MMIHLLLLACGDTDKSNSLDTAEEATTQEPSVESLEPSTEPSTEDSETDNDSGEDSTVDSGVVDPEDTGTDSDPNACPPDVVCVDGFPFVHRGNTDVAVFDDFDSYSCSPSTNESGSEVLYRVTLPKDGFLALNLPEDAMGSGTDIDIHLLSSLDSQSCIDRGHWVAGSLLTAGTYWVVADTWVNSSGEAQSGTYSLEFGFTSFDSLHQFGMSQTMAEDALFAFDTAWSNGDTSRFEYAITDFSLHSSLERMWIVDFRTGGLIGNLHVAHGESSASSSDDGWAVSFSNVSGSHQSSLGMMKGAEDYYGSWDYSMRMDGLESGYNHNVRSRAIVVHGWTGSRPEYVQYYGSVAPTWGCPAVDDREVEWVVETLMDGALLLFSYPDGDWSLNSDYLQ